MTCYIVVEEPYDSVFVRELLKPEFDSVRHDIRIVDGGGWSGTDTLARSLLVARRQPTLLVASAGSSDPRGIRERREFLEDALGQVASRSLWKILLVEPSLEALLFSDKVTIQALIGKEISDEQLIRGQYVPQQMLSDLLQISGRNRLAETLTDRLEHLDFTALRQHPFARELKQAVAETLQRAAA